MSISSCDTETRTLRTTSTPISSTTITAIATITPAASPARTPARPTWRGSSGTSPSARRRGRAARYPTRSGGVHTGDLPERDLDPHQVPRIERGHHADRGEIQDGDASVATHPERPPREVAIHHTFSDLAAEEARRPEDQHQHQDENVTTSFSWNGDGTLNPSSRR